MILFDYLMFYFGAVFQEGRLKQRGHWVSEDQKGWLKA